MCQAGFALAHQVDVLDHGLDENPPAHLTVQPTVDAAADPTRRVGELRTVGIGLSLFGACGTLLAVPSLAVVLLGFIVAGVGIVWAIVGFNTALQTRTPLAIQGRVSAASEISLTVAQTTSIATGAALSTIVDYRILLVAMSAVVIASSVYLVTRREPPIRAEVAPLTID
jgi:uncharacterized membrane protein YfcA